jgi:hypothetical protein
MEQVYIFGNEATAEAFKMTAYHFGHDGQRVGSALILSPDVYEEVIDKTYAVPAAITAEIVKDIRVKGKVPA